MIAERDTTLDIYMNDISQYKLLTIEQENELAALVSQGSEAAIGKLMVSNLRLVIAVAHEFRYLGTLNDLVSHGNIGLYHAARKFDPAKGSKFSSYAAWWIKQSIRRCSTEDKTIKIPIATARKMYLIYKAQIKLSEQLGRNPTLKEISLKVGFTEATIKKLLMLNVKTQSLDVPIDSAEGKQDFYKFIPDDQPSIIDCIVKAEFHIYIEKFVDQLSEVERIIIINRFGLRGHQPATLEEVSIIISRTRERVRQIQNQALKKLKYLIKQVN